MDCEPTTETTSPHIGQSLRFNVVATTNRSLDVETNDSALQFDLTELSPKKPWSPLRQPLGAVVLLATAYVVVAIVGIVSNSVVVAVICRQARMRTVINYFLANLAVADILVCVIVLPITLLQNIFTGMTSSTLLLTSVFYPSRLGGVMVRASDSLSRGRGFDSGRSNNDAWQVIHTHTHMCLSR